MMTLGYLIQDSLSTVKVSGNPVFDMIIATLISGLLLQYLPTVTSYFKSLFSSIGLWIYLNFSFHSSLYKHRIEITATSVEKGKPQYDQDGYAIPAPVHSPVINSVDNLPMIMGTLHYFQQKKIQYEITHTPGCSSAIGHVQPQKCERTTREQLQKSILSFIPLQSVLCEGMCFTFVTTAPQTQNENNEEDDGRNYKNNSSKSSTSSTIQMTVEGNKLQLIHEFLVARMQEEVNLAYPPPEDTDKQFMFELNTSMHGNSHGNGRGLSFFRTSYSTSKTFNTIFYEEKEQLIAALNHFEQRTGPWDAKRERPHKLIILLEGTPGTGKSSTIKAIANKTKRHLVCINSSDISDDSMLTRLFREETVNFLGPVSYQNEVIPHDRRILVFEDIDCTGNNEWLFDRDRKKPDSPKSPIAVDIPDAPEFPDYSEPFGMANRNKKSKKKETIKLGPTLGGFLNILDGVAELQSHIVILTTNKAHLIDPALFRPGRIDVRITMGDMKGKDLQDMLEFYFETVLTAAQIEKLSEIKPQFTASAVQEICQQSTSIDDAIKHMNCPQVI